MKLLTRVQILFEVVYVLFEANTLRKGMNPSVLCPAMSKLLGKLDSLALVRQTIKVTLGSLFNGISTFIGYLMPKASF